MARVVVIGGGITGTLSALELVRSGCEVVLLEAAHIGAGSSSRTAAGIRQQFSTTGTVIAMRHSVNTYRDFGELVGGDARAIVQNGYLFLHDDDDAWQQAQQTILVQQQAGLSEVEALGRDDLVKRFPWVDGAVAVGGTWCPSDGFLLPQNVYQEAARRFRELGGQVVNGAAVQQAEHRGRSLVAVNTPKGRFEADVFVECTNAWAGRTGEILGGTPLPIDPLKRYLWFLHREQALPAETLRNMPMVVAPSGAYCRPENADTLLFGKKYDVAASPGFSYDDQDTIDPRFTHNAGHDAVPYEVWMELASMVPALAEFSGVAATTAGFYGTTPDHNPYIDYDPAVDNLVRAVGFSGHGAMMGPFSARAVSALVTAGCDIPAVELPEGSVPLDVFRIGRSFDHAETMVI